MVNDISLLSQKIPMRIINWFLYILPLQIVETGKIKTRRMDPVKKQNGTTTKLWPNDTQMSQLYIR